ncbi:MAG TPA: prolyl oligopeptidase family serine peptidase [Vicinamibacterales bacterium]|nr:prolyl oligopeptidase family serine peptidase [Vicinamibacterales bacterium]
MKFAPFALALSLLAQSTSTPLLPPTPADFGQWERLSTIPDRGGLSPDGRWLAYGINRTNGENDLRVTSVADGGTKTIPFGAQPAFSSDSRWAAVSVGYSETQQDKMRKDKKPIRRKLTLLSLASGEMSTIDSVESFAFSADGRHLLMRHYAPERPAGRAEPDPATVFDPEESTGVTAVVRDLASGRDTTFGNVADAAWQTKGRLLAIAIAAEDRAGNGVQVFDPSSGTLRVLDSASARYLGLTWRKDADDLAVLKSKTDDTREGATYAVLAWTAVGSSAEKPHQYDPANDRTLGAGRRLVAFRRPSWSEDGSTVFVGVAAWSEKPASARNDKEKARDKDAAETVDPPTVDIWHPRDVDVMPKQKVGATRDRQRSLLAAWPLDRPALTVLGHDFYETVVPLAQRNLAYAVSWGGTALDRSWGRFGASTISLVDVTTGERTKVVDRADDRYVRASPGGKYIVFFMDGQASTIDTARRTVTNITRSIPTSFVDRESDSTDVQRPFYGQAGWTKDDRDFLLYDKFDVWEIAANGSKATKLTDGAAEQIEYRYAGLDPQEEAIDRSKPVYLQMMGTWTKKSGVARLAPGAPAPEKLLWLDKSVTRLAKAKDADVYEYVLQSYEDSPDAFVGSPDLKSMKQVTATNAFQGKFAWGRAELIEFKSEKGQRLQGVLRYPAGYERGKKYPMVVYVYEKRSDSLHQYSAPSEREYYNVSTFTTAGYFLFEPDIVFRPREPGLSVVECVRPAVAAVAQMGVIDPKRVGMIGHSWGGFDTAFMATHTDIFAAAVAGAPITDLVSNYGSHHFSSGIAETDHIETGQQRMQVPVWEDVAAYTRNSAVFGVSTMTTPLLIEVGDADGTVFWHQGVELYNAARRAKKDVVLLVYGGEDHSLRQKANQVDYHHRILDWFGHYLKGDPAPAWITSGVSFLDKEKATKKSGS